MSVNRLVVNAEGPEIRVGVIRDGTLSEYFLEPKHGRGTVGNIYRGKVTRVLPGMQAAFVDLGPSVERAAFLYVADILGSGDSRRLFAEDDTDDDPAERMSRKQAASRKIEELIRPGQQILVQIVKDPIGLKGARVTGFLSLPGRYSVFMPTVDHVGVSRRIASDKERKRLRKLVNKVRTKGGIIVRTAAEGRPDQEIEDDVDYLIRLWGEIGRREKALKGPGLVYADLDLVLRTIRDLLGEDTKEIVIDNREQFERARKFTTAFLPSAVERIVHYDGAQPSFDFYGIEAELRAALKRRVPLKSGGSLVIDQGEALTAIDINTGSFVGESDLEETVTRNNVEACKEIARQLRLRNIGGIIVIDFVDMEKEGNRNKVWDAFHKALAADRSRCNVTRISELGLVEMTRKRTRESLNQLLMEPCPDCEGGGRVKAATTVAHEILREIRRVGATVKADSIEIECAPAVADAFRNLDRVYVDELEKKFQKRIVITASRSLPRPQYKIGGKLSEEPAPPRERERKRTRGKSVRGKSKASDKSSKANDKSSKASDKPSKASDKPGKASDKPGKASDKPGKLGKASDKADKSPDKGAKATDKAKPAGNGAKQAQSIDKPATGESKARDDKAGAEPDRARAETPRADGKAVNGRTDDDQADGKRAAGEAAPRRRRSRRSRAKKPDASDSTED